MSDFAPDVAAPVRTFRALGDPIRLRLVALLAHGELCVCHLVSALRLPQSTVSRQLGLLKAAGLVEARREGSWMHYRLSVPGDRVSRQLLRTVSKQLHTVSRDLRRRVGSKGPKGCR